MWPSVFAAAAVKFRGTAAQPNFSLTNYTVELEMQDKVTLALSLCIPGRLLRRCCVRRSGSKFLIMPAVRCVVGPVGFHG